MPKTCPRADRAPRNLHARLALAALCCGLLVFALTFERHSVESMDVRTYVQMIHGVAMHGLPYWDNGPVDRFPELVVPWAVPARGHVWGVYGPLYPYLAAPFFRWGSLPYVAKFTVALSIPLALVSFRLARRAAKSEWTGTLAAVLAVLATPILGKSLEMTAYPLAVVFAAWATDASLGWRDGGHRARGAALAGLLWGAATATHAVCFPMALTTLLYAALSDDAPIAWLAIARRSALRFAHALAAFAFALLPLAYLNHVRFDSWNPISYGPVPWARIDPNLAKQNIASQVVFAAPCIAFLALVAAAFVVLRRRQLSTLFVAPLLLAAAFVATLRERFTLYAKVAFGYVVDLSALDLGGGYEHPKEGFGQLFNGWVVTAALQVSPFLALAILPLRRPGVTRRRVLVPFASGAAVFAAMILRANMPLVDAFGFPWIYIRYTLPALPVLACVSALGFEELPITRRHVAFGAGVALAISLFLLKRGDESTLPTQLVVLALPLAAAALALALSWRRAFPPRAAAWAGALTVGVGISIGVGHGFEANNRAAAGCDQHARRLLRALPERYAVAGWTGGADLVFATSAVRDVQYADMHRLDDWRKVKKLFDHWHAEDRPIFVVWDGPRFESVWPDIRFDALEDAPGLHRVVWISPQSATR